MMAAPIVVLPISVPVTYAVPYFSASILPHQIISFMSSSNPPPTLMDKAAMDAWVATSPVDFGFSLVIQNLTTGEEAMVEKGAKIPANFSTTWIIKYLDHPILQHFDLSRHGIPFLTNPMTIKSDDNQTDIAQPMMCTSCTFPAGRTHTLRAVATLIYWDRLLRPVERGEDYVMVEILTPPLPLTFATYDELPDGQARRLVLLHYALSSFAVTKRKFSSGNTQALAAFNTLTTMLYGNKAAMATNSNAMKLVFAFSIPSTEKTAGSAVIPAVLKLLNFMFPTLSPQQPVDYDILQPHRFAYTFRLRNLGGWKVLGAVNTVISEFKSSFEFQTQKLNNEDLYKLTQQPSEFVHHELVQHTIPHTIVPGWIGSYVSTYKIGNKDPNGIFGMDTNYSNASNSILCMYIKDISEATTQISAFTKANKKTFRKVLIESYEDMLPSWITDKLNKEDMKQLSDAHWIDWAMYQGSKMIDDFLLVSNESRVVARSPNIDIVLQRFIHALKTTAKDVDIVPFSNVQISCLISMIFQFCTGLASEVINEHTPQIQVGTDLKAGVVNDARVVVDDITVSLEDFISFLTSCLGKNMENTTSLALLRADRNKKKNFKYETHLAKYLLVNAGLLVDTFSLFFPITLFHMKTMSHLGRQMQRAHHHDKDINDARNVFLGLLATEADLNKLKKALAYAIFSGDPAGLP